MPPVPSPGAYGVGVAYFWSLSRAGAAVSRVLAERTLPATLEFLDSTCINTVEDYAGIGLQRDAGALLIFGQDGDTRTVEADLERIARICKVEGALEVRVAGSKLATQSILEARRAVLPSLSRLAPLTILEDATVPRSRIAEMVDRITEVADRHELVIGTFGHAGDGNLHPTCVVDPDQPRALERVEAAFGEIFAAALDLGGSVTGEHGVGLAKKKFLVDQLGESQIALLRRIKAAFDPYAILNPGKLGS